MKDAAIGVLCALYKQLGEEVKEVVNQSDINALLKKKVLEEMRSVVLFSFLLRHS